MFKGNPIWSYRLFSFPAVIATPDEKALIRDMFQAR